MRLDLDLRKHPHYLSGCPFSTTCGSDVSLIQRSRRLPEGCGPARPDVGNNRADISGPPLCMDRLEPSIGQRSLPSHEVDLAGVASQLFAPGLGSSKGVLGRPRNHLPLMLGPDDLQS